MDTALIPTISVVLPVYNAEKYIRKSLESILAQTFTDFEILLVDNASTDSTIEILKSYTDPRIRIIINPSNLGLIASLNIGLNSARGKYIARMDHDDIALPERFQKEYDFLESHQDIVLVGTWSNIMDSNENFIRIHKNPLQNNVIKYELMFGNTITHPSIMMRRDIVNAVGGYDSAWINTEDYNLYSRLIRNHKLANIGEPLINYRVHGASLTNEASSQVVMHENTKKMIRLNISNYIPLSDTEHWLITQVLIKRYPDPKVKLSNIIKAYALHKKIYHAYIAQEKLEDEDMRQIHKRYVARRNLMFKTYLIGKYHLLTKKHA